MSGEERASAGADTDPELLRYDPFRGDESVREYAVPKGKRPVLCKGGCGASIVWLDHDLGDGSGVWLPLDMGKSRINRDPARPRDRGYRVAEIHRCPSGRFRPR